MFVPSLAGKKSGEVGHPNYQHPQRLREGTYNAEVDRVPLLVVATALRALSVGGRESVGELRQRRQPAVQGKRPADTGGVGVVPRIEGDAGSPGEEAGGVAGGGVRAAPGKRAAAGGTVAGGEASGQDSGRAGWRCHGDASGGGSRGGAELGLR